ncbi:hypothetical protein [Eisenbergiella porci]
MCFLNGDCRQKLPK